VIAVYLYYFIEIYISTLILVCTDA